MKRRGFKLVVFLLLGAIVNVAVAWGCNFSRFRGDRPWVVARTEGDLLHWWQTNAPPGFEMSHEYESSNRFEGFGREFLQWPAAPNHTVSRYLIQRGRSGWPTFAMERSFWHDAEGDRKFTQHAWRPPILDIKEDGVPMRALWPGFAINTLFYGVVLWLVFAVPLALRRRRRIKRGLCPACAYPIGESDMCTECGRHLPPVSR